MLTTFAFVCSKALGKSVWDPIITQHPRSAPTLPSATSTKMASSNAPNESYSKMDTGDVEAIGANCQMPFCRQLDLLPFRCESCKG